MNGDLKKKKLGIVSDTLNRVPARLFGKANPEYRRLLYLKHKEKIDQKNRERYHRKYKLDPLCKKRRKEYWKKYVSTKPKGWRKRARKYKNKSRSELSQSQVSKLRKLYTEWSKKNWNKRVEYAREYRRRQPQYGFRQQIAKAKRSGDIRKLAEVCLFAIVRAYDESSK